MFWNSLQRVRSNSNIGRQDNLKVFARKKTEEHREDSKNLLRRPVPIKFKIGGYNRESSRVYTINLNTQLCITVSHYRVDTSGVI